MLLRGEVPPESRVPSPTRASFINGYKISRILKSFREDLCFFYVRVSPVWGLKPQTQIMVGKNFTTFPTHYFSLNFALPSLCAERSGMQWIVPLGKLWKCMVPGWRCGICAAFLESIGSLVYTRFAPQRRRPGALHSNSLCLGKRRDLQNPLFFHPRFAAYLNFTILDNHYNASGSSALPAFRKM